MSYKSQQSAEAAAAQAQNHLLSRSEQPGRGDSIPGLMAFRHSFSFAAALVASVTYCATLVLMPASAFSRDETYKYLLGPEDKLKISVHEWRPSRAKVHTWEALTGEFVIGPDGYLALPLIGHTRAAGLSPAELSDKIGQALKSRIGLAVKPSSVVQVVGYRPVFVVGDIESPGAYDYRPNLTVMQAASLGGGLRRAKQVGIAQEMVRLRANVKVFKEQLRAQEARRKRLELELSELTNLVNKSAGGKSKNAKAKQDVEDFKVTPELLNSLDPHERLVYESYASSLTNEVQAFEELTARHASELEFLEQNIKLRQTQLEETRAQTEKLRALENRGLTTSNRRIAAARAQAFEEGVVLDLYTTRMRTQESLSQAEISLLKLRNRRRTVVANELSQTQVQIQEIKQRLIGADEELAMLADLAPGEDKNLKQIRYTIVRFNPDQGDHIEIAAQPTSRVQPGDTIKVESIKRGSTPVLRPFGRVNTALGGS